MVIFNSYVKLPEGNKSQNAAMWFPVDLDSHIDIPQGFVWNRKHCPHWLLCMKALFRGISSYHFVSVKLLYKRNMHSSKMEIRPARLATCHQLHQRSPHSTQKHLSLFLFFFCVLCACVFAALHILAHLLLVYNCITMVYYGLLIFTLHSKLGLAGGDQDREVRGQEQRGQEQQGAGHGVTVWQDMVGWWVFGGLYYGYLT